MPNMKRTDRIHKTVYLNRNTLDEVYRQIKKHEYPSLNAYIEEAINQKNKTYIANEKTQEKEE